MEHTAWCSALSISATMAAPSAANGTLALPVPLQVLQMRLERVSVPGNSSYRPP